MELSYPEGFSVNYYVDKNNYQGQEIKLKYLTVDTLAQRIHELGPGCLIYKRDLGEGIQATPPPPLPRAPETIVMLVP